MHDILPSKSNIPPHHTLTSLSLTHVLHGSDIYSKIFAHLTLSPLAITCSYVAVILTTRDLTVILMLAGQLLNECVNFVLKRLVKQARPTGKSTTDIRIRFGEEGEVGRRKKNNLWAERERERRFAYDRSGQPFANAQFHSPIYLS